MKRIFVGLLAGLVAVGVGLVLCGCEAESAAQAEIVVTPSSASLAVGQSVVFTATGWDGYSWSLEVPGIGTLSPRTGDTVKYTCLSGSNIVQTVKVTGLGTGGTSSTNGQSFSVSGQALVQHIVLLP